MSGGPDSAAGRVEEIAELERQVGEAASIDEIVLPPYPGVALRVQRALASEEFGAADVARIIGSDNALAADVLRCANSAFYRRGGTVTSLTQAVARVGAKQVLKLAFTCVLAGQAHATGALVALRRMVWIEGLASAAIAQELGRMRGLRVEEGFTLGLLHDFGKVVAVWRLESLIEQHRIRGAWPLHVWAAIAERQHIALGRALAERWKLPPIIGEVIAAHHRGGACSDPGLLEVIRTCDRIVSLLVKEVGVDAAALAAVPRLSSQEQAAVAAVVAALPEFISAFEPIAAPRPPAIPAPVAAHEEPAGTVALRAPFEVSARVGARTVACTAVAVGPNALILECREALPLSRLVRVTLPAAGGAFTVWALPHGSQATLGGAHRVDLRPVALDADGRERWARLVAEVAPAG